MTFPVHVGPSTITTNRDDRILICQPDGRITGQADGFFTRDTRFISGYDLWINGTRPILLGSGSIQSFSSRFEFTNDALVDPDGAIERQTLGLRLDRTIADGVHEDYDLENFAPRPVRLTIEIAVVSDFADIFDVKRGQIVRRGELNTRWFRSRGELRSTYTNRDFRRELVIAVERPGSPPQFANGRLVFDVDATAQGHVAHLPQVVPGHPVETPAVDARVQRRGCPDARGRCRAPAERQHRVAEPDRRSRVGTGGP